MGRLPFCACADRLCHVASYCAALKHSSKRGGPPKVSKGRPESPLGSEAFVASGDKEKAERVSRNERPLAATIEAADAPAGAKPLPSVKQLF